MNPADLLSQLPVDQIAGQFGVERRTAENALGVAVPALLPGMQANAQDIGGAPRRSPRRWASTTTT